MTAAALYQFQTYMTKEEPIVTQPTLDEQRQYKSLSENTPTEVTILHTKKKYLVRWLKYGQLNKLSKLLVGKHNKDNDDNADEAVLDTLIRDSKLACKAAAIYVTNGFWSLHLRYWFLWRWFYYVKQYDPVQLSPILVEGKKKVPLMQFLGATTSLIGAKDTLLQMTMTEAEHILQGLSSELPSPEQSTESISSGQDTSSSDS